MGNTGRDRSRARLAQKRKIVRRQRVQALLAVPTTKVTPAIASPKLDELVHHGFVPKEDAPELFRNAEDDLK